MAELAKQLKRNKTKFPVKESYGIACCRMTSKNIDSIEILLICKQHTYEFLDFVNGKYHHLNESGLKRMLNKMTVYEKNLIKLFDFDTIWKYVWLDNCANNYNYCKNKFNKLLLDKNRLTILIESSSNVELPWEIPKGRKNYRESSINCAIREFHEETNVNPVDYNLLSDIQQELIFVDKNIKYKYRYYFALLNDDSDVDLTYKSVETSNIAWRKLSDLPEYLVRILTPIFKRIIKQINN